MPQHRARNDIEHRRRMITRAGRRRRRVLRDVKVRLRTALAMAHCCQRLRCMRSSGCLAYLARAHTCGTTSRGCASSKSLNASVLSLDGLRTAGIVGTVRWPENLGGCTPRRFHRKKICDHKRSSSLPSRRAAASKTVMRASAVDEKPWASATTRSTVRCSTFSPLY